MSNFTGVTFAQQKVLPSDDAIIRRASLSDGVLYGCEMSYSGSTLTMGSGQLLICGRQIRHPSAENWAIVDATSGFARLVLTVDLTKTSSKDSFEQVVDSIEYATSQDGFPELVREDVNVSGTRYQVVACVVSLGTGGITGIVNQLSPVEGGGGGLNFKVVPGMTQPGTATENTIWVKAEKINNYYFSATQPENMVDYDVWFPIDTSSTVAFSATKKNPVMVYPLSAKQYVGGALVGVTTKSWKGGKWVDWWSGELYGAGNEFASVTGGWTTNGFKAANSTVSVTSGTKKSDRIVLQGATSVLNMLGTDSLIDLAGYSGLYMQCKPTSVAGSGQSVGIAVSKTKTINLDNVPGRSEATNSLTEQTVKIDVSGLNEKYYVVVYANLSPLCVGDIYDIYLVK